MLESGEKPLFVALILVLVFISRYMKERLERGKVLPQVASFLWKRKVFLFEYNSWKIKW